MLHQLSYQTKWEQVVMGVDYKLVDVELGDDYSYPQFKYMETSCITIKKK